MSDWQRALRCARQQDARLQGSVLGPPLALLKLPGLARSEKTP